MSPGLAGYEVGFQLSTAQGTLKPGVFSIAVNWLPPAPAALGEQDGQP